MNILLEVQFYIMTSFSCFIKSLLSTNQIVVMQLTSRTTNATTTTNLATANSAELSISIADRNG